MSERDFVGYGEHPPHPQWPGGARLALNFVLNYEEGSEPSIEHGEVSSESGLSDAHGLGQISAGRDLAAESLFEYGSRVGFWRLLRLFRERSLPLTVFGCAVAGGKPPGPGTTIRLGAKSTPASTTRTP